MPDTHVIVANIGLYVDIAGVMTLVAAMRDAELQTDLDTGEAAPEVDYEWKEYVPKQLSWRASATSVILIDDATGAYAASHQALYDAQRARTPITVSVQRPGGAKESGDAYVTGFRRGGAYDNLMEGNFSLLGTGKLVEA